MLAETMKKLGFTAQDIAKRTFIDEEADAVYIWDAKGYQLVTFPLPDTIRNLAERVRWNDDSSIMAIVNQQVRATRYDMIHTCILNLSLPYKP